MNRFAKGLGIAGLVLATVVAVVAGLWLANPRPPRRPRAGTNLDGFRGYVDAWTRSGAAPSMLAAAVQGGRIVFWHGSGQLSPLEPAAPDLDTIYHWWSMTKVFTATAVMRLADQGRIDIAAPAGTYLPWLLEYNREVAGVTIRQLLSHSSGLPDNVPAVIGWTHTADKAERNQTEHLRSVFGGYSTLKYAPGTRQRYSNVGYMLLGAVIEAVTGESYLDYVEREIVRAAGMRRTAFRFDRIEGFDGGNAAAGSHLFWRMETPFLYVYYGKKLDGMLLHRTSRRFWFTEIIPDSHPPTGLRGSARDLAAYASSMLEAWGGRDRLVTAPTARAMMSPQLPADAAGLSAALGAGSTMEAGFGLGFKLQVYEGRRVAGHLGGGPGFNLGLWLLPDDDTALIVLSSDTRIRMEEIMETFAEALVTEGMLAR
jgi:D-alanyl-D-alanine carboxypeptidase